MSDTQVKAALRLALKATGHTLKSVSLALGMEETYLSRQLRRNKTHTNKLINNVLGVVGIGRADFESYLSGRLGDDPRLHLQEIIGREPFSRPRRRRGNNPPEFEDWRSLEGAIGEYGKRRVLPSLGWHVQNGSREGRAEAWSLLGVLARREGSTSRAAWCSQRALGALGSVDGEVYGRILLRIAELFTIEARFDLAKDCCVRALPVLNDRQDWIYRGFFGLGVSLFHQGAFNEALLWFRLVRRNDEKLFIWNAAVHWQGLSLIRIGEFSRALDLVESVAEAYGERHFFVLFLEGACREGLGDYPEALRLYGRASSTVGVEGVGILDMLELRLNKIRCRVAMGQSLREIAVDVREFRREAIGVSNKFSRLYALEIGKLIEMRTNIDVFEVMVKMRRDIRRLS